MIKLQKRVAELEMTKSKLADELDEREDEDEDKSGFKITTPEFAYNNLKVMLRVHWILEFVYNNSKVIQRLYVYWRLSTIT